MAKRFLISTALVSIALGFAASARASANDQPRLGYFLPKMYAGARASQRIVRCPTADRPTIDVITTLPIDGRLGPDPTQFINVDGRSGFLSGRSTHLELRQDGTLKAFNASTQGEGGAVLSAVIGVAATVGAMSVGAPVAASAAFAAASQERGTTPSREPRCTPETRRAVERAAVVESQLQSLRARIAAGPVTDAEAQVLRDLTAELGDLVDGLTLSTSLARVDPTRAQFNGAGQGTVIHVAPIDYSPWFGDSGESVGDLLDRSHAPGRYGFRVAFGADPQMLIELGAPPSQPTTPRNEAYLYYQRPIAVSIDASPCPTAWNGNDCPMPEHPDPSHWYATDPAPSSTLYFPQLSRLFSLPIGHGGIFGTRTARAEFDEQGAPSVLEFGSTSGGSDIAAVINAANAAIPTVRDARTDALNRRIDELKARNELHSLLAPTPATPTSGQ